MRIALNENARRNGLNRLKWMAAGFAFCLILSAAPFVGADCRGVVATVAPDYSSGAVSIIHADPVGAPRTHVNNLNPTISDIGVASYRENFYILERFQSNNISKFHIDNPTQRLWQYSTQDPTDTVDSNPYDLIFVNPQKAYLLRFGSTKAWIVNPSATNEDQFKIGELDLSAYADADGVPEMCAGAIAGNKLFIVMQRLVDWCPAPDVRPYVAVFDTQTDQEINTGKGQGGLLGIPLPIDNPNSCQYLKENGRIYIGGVGRYGFCGDGYTGGIVLIYAEDYASRILYDDGTPTDHPFGLLYGMGIASGTKGYFVGYDGWEDASLYSFDSWTGAVNPNPVAGLAHKDISGLENLLQVDKNGMLWVCEGLSQEVSLVDTTVDLIDDSVFTNLKPIDVTFCDCVHLTIKANGERRHATVLSGNPVKIDITLDAKDYAGVNAEWWVAAYSPYGGFFSYVYPIGWVEGLERALVSPLFDFLGDVTLLNGPLAGGMWTFYFVLDEEVNGVPDITWINQVTVHVVE
jgi:hypothetical protein